MKTSLRCSSFTLSLLFSFALLGGFVLAAGLQKPRPAKASAKQTKKVNQRPRTKRATQPTPAPSALAQSRPPRLPERYDHADHHALVFHPPLQRRK